MNFRDLEYILAVASHKSFSAAAASCAVSQPSLSAQIRKVEDELDVRLFERDSRPVRLTPFGRIFAEKAARILKDIEDIKGLARQTPDILSGQLRLGAIATLAPYYFPEVLRRIGAQAPQLDLILEESQTAQLTEALLSGRLDAALLTLPVDRTLFEAVELFRDPFYLAVPDNHPLAGLEHAGDMDFLDEKLILLDDGHCLRQQVLDLCRRGALQENASFRATSLETIRHLVAEGQGLTLMPAIARRDHDGITYIRLKNPRHARTIGLVWRKTSERKALLSVLARVLSSNNALIDRG